MAAPDSQLLAAAPKADPATQHQATVTASPPSLRGAPGFAVAAPKSPQGAPGFAVAPQGGALVAPPSPQGPPGFWVAPPPQGTPLMAPQQQHFAPVMMPLPASEQCTPMVVQAASMGMMLAKAARQPPQGMAPRPSVPMVNPPSMEMLQAQAGHMMAPPPPLPLDPPPVTLQHHQLPQADPSMMAQPPLPLGPPPTTQQQPPLQAGPVMMAQPALPFGPPPMMPQHPAQGDPMMMMAQPQLSAQLCKRQRIDQYDMPYGQHMTGHQQETAILNMAMGPSYGPNVHNELPSFGAPQLSLPPGTTSTLYVEGLPSNCTRREVAHIFRQYMGFREVRLVNKGSSRHVMCFVDFATPAHAFLAMGTLQGYKFDERDPRSHNLQLQFSHSPRVGSHGGC